jgi:hypothetical protein
MRHLMVASSTALQWPISPRGAAQRGAAATWASSLPCVRRGGWCDGRAGRGLDDWDGRGPYLYEEQQGLNQEQQYIGTEHAYIGTAGAHFYTSSSSCKRLSVDA